MARGKTFNELRSGFYDASETRASIDEEGDLYSSQIDIPEDYEYRTHSWDIRETRDLKRIHEEEKAENIQAAKYGFSGEAAATADVVGEETIKQTTKDVEKKLDPKKSWIPWAVGASLFYLIFIKK